METFVKTNIESGVARITLSRPEKRNALKREFIEQLIAAVESIANDQAVRVLILQAEGTVFCAGMDLGEMQKRAESDSGKEEWQQDSVVYANLLTAIYNLEIPTIAMLQGPVLAGGVGMVLACDFIVAVEAATIMLPEPMRGITAAMVTPFLIERIGVGPASHLLLSCERLSMTRARNLGLIYFLAASLEDLETKVTGLVNSILTGSRSALAITKQHIKKCGNAQLEALLKDSIGVSAQARETSDAREGLAAFLEKRKPNWQPE